MNETVLLLIRDLAACYLAVFFYGIIMSVRIRPLLISAVSGSLGYVTFRLIFLTGHEWLGYLAASFLIAVSAEILARFCKMPATMFVLPGIIPLVPGVGLYQTMLCLVRNDLTGFQSSGVKTLFISGIIAVTVAVVSGAARAAFHPHPKKTTSAGST